MKKFPIPIKVLNKQATIPTYGTQYSAGADIYACLGENLEISPFQRVSVPTGISIEIPEGYYGMVVPRSGLSVKHGITLINSPGIIDSDYRGELKVLLVNLSNTSFFIEHNMRIAQLIIHKYENICFEKVLELSDTSRGHNGFGSTGI